MKTLIVHTLPKILLDVGHNFQNLHLKKHILLKPLKTIHILLDISFWAWPLHPELEDWSGPKEWKPFDESLSKASVKLPRLRKFELSNSSSSVNCKCGSVHWNRFMNPCSSFWHLRSWLATRPLKYGKSITTAPSWLLSLLFRSRIFHLCKN